MRPTRAHAVAVLLVLTVPLSAACSGLVPKRYEYDEELFLEIDGSARMHVNASIASLVALHGAELDPRPEARPDRGRVRALFSAPGVTVATPTFFRRQGRRFVHVVVTAPRVGDLARVAPFSWSAYRFGPDGESLVFRQVVGRATARTTGDVRWTGGELVAFRIHVPSRVLFENATSDVQRGNILVWEQALSDRIAGAPLDLHVEMESESILHSTLLLFVSTVVGVALVFAGAIWWAVRRGRWELGTKN
jgi:hypothetical protein